MLLKFNGQNWKENFNKVLINAEYSKKLSLALSLILLLWFLNIMSLFSHNGSSAKNFVTQNKVEYDMP